MPGPDDPTDDRFGRWYAPDGRTRISAGEASELLAASQARRVASSLVGDWWVSTVFLAMDMGLLPRPGVAPVLWETLTFAPAGCTEAEQDLADRFGQRHRSLPAALSAHHALCVELAAERGIEATHVVHEPPQPTWAAAYGLADWRTPAPAGATVGGPALAGLVGHLNDFFTGARDAVSAVMAELGATFTRTAEAMRPFMRALARAYAQQDRARPARRERRAQRRRLRNLQLRATQARVRARRAAGKPSRAGIAGLSRQVVPA